MSKILLDYAVSFTQTEGIAAANLDFLHQLGVVTLPSSTPPTNEITSATGDQLVPATIELNGFFLAGSIVNAEFTSDVQPTAFEAPYTCLTDITASDLAVLWADFIKGIDQLTAVANGNVIEVRAFEPGENVAIANASLDVTGAQPFEPQIVEVVDPEQLPYYTDQATDIQAAFDGGLNRVYLIMVTAADEVAALINEKECDFYSVYGSQDFTPTEYLQAFSAWEGVKGFSSSDRALIKANANTENQCIFYEDTLIADDVRAYYGIYSFAALLSASVWRNQQYIPNNPANGAPVTELGLAESLFADRASFFIWDEEQGTRLSFFVAGGKSITTPYINREIQVVMQTEMLNFLVVNQPMNIETNRLLLTQIGNRILVTYEDNGLLDPEGENSISITKGQEAFIVEGEMQTTESEALWRIDIDARQTSL